ncbi:hypothetical protein EKO04_007475 [Ascochyta lentis]|uniref:Myb-like DNA-binding domain-containing protein n=1 Tax=Ascochyta lentis TaxID=205686 RepID=A0A8H7J0U3_9PLEO|nr:hypothetical protein EKO04_007475 [Ascochyta lentis]
MPSEQENIQYLYLVLTHGGTPTINWEPICDALQLEKGAATKRWSRLKKAVENGENPAVSNYDFLWLMIKHSTRDKPFDWDAIAAQCNSTKGACSKRYSRLKLAFENVDTPPRTPSKAGKSKTTDDTPTATPKRKRTPAKKAGADKFQTATDSDEDEEPAKPKRAKSTPKAKPKPKNGFRAGDVKSAEAAQAVIKNEPIDDDGGDDSDVFLDAQERAVADAEVEEDEVSPTPSSLPSSFSAAFTHAREMADVLLNRKTGVSATDREELEGMLGVFGEEGV